MWKPKFIFAYRLYRFLIVVHKMKRWYQYHISIKMPPEFKKDYK